MGTVNKQAVIGIVPSFDNGAQFIPGSPIERQFIRREYSYMIAQVGGVPLLLNPDMPLAYIMQHCDGIVLSGGADISPSRYGQKRIAAVKRIEPAKRFAWEKKLITACDAFAMPILGICYGMQRLNVHYGGALIQDVPTMRPDAINHDGTEHPVRFYTEFLGMKDAQVHTINSRHHQAIDELADGFSIAADAPDGIIEAIEGRGHFGIQWHPESDATGAHIYRAFTEHCLGYNRSEKL